MSHWEVWTWLSVLALGPGSLAVFIFFLRDVKRVLREAADEEPEP